jgi:hypothetical protein
MGNTTGRSHSWEWGRGHRDGYHGVGEVGEGEKQKLKLGPVGEIFWERKV